MKKFMLHYMAPLDAIAAMSEVTPEQREAGMKTWFAWRDSIGDKLLDLGSPLGPGTGYPDHGNSGDLDSNIVLAGYSLIQANDLDEAKGLVKNHPHLEWNDKCSIHIYECLEM